MIGKNTAVFYTFLWGLAYGFIVSLIMALLALLILPAAMTNKNDPENFNINMGVLNGLGFLSFLASLGVLYFTYSKCYKYGLEDCKKGVEQ